MTVDWKTLTQWDDDMKEIQYGRITNRDYWVYHDYKHMTTFLEDSYLKVMYTNRRLSRLYIVSRGCLHKPLQASFYDLEDVSMDQIRIP